MNQQNFDKNLKAFSEIEYDTKLKKFLEENSQEEENGVYLDVNQEGTDILAVQREEHMYYLSSRYTEEPYLEKLDELAENANYMGVFIVFGMSNLEGVRRIMGKLKDTQMMLIYEPDERIFQKVMLNIDASDVIANEHILFAVGGINENIYREFLIGFTSYSNRNYIYYYCMRNYFSLYAEKYKTLLQYDLFNKENHHLSKNTLIMYAKELGENTLGNYVDFVKQSSINKLCHELHSMEGIDKIPAILVAAGPSLDKNIEDLKKAQGRALIFAVDTSLKTLLNHNIIPDLCITIDGHKPAMLFAHSKCKDIPMIVCTGTNRNLYPLLDGRRFYFSDGNNLIINHYGEKTDDILKRLETGGSVANNAFSAVQVLGFKNIILVGQDLAYPNKKSHTGDAYGTEKNDNLNGKQLFEVEDVFGGKVLTESNMDSYRRWFEQQIARYPDFNVVDATEGGAKIHGSRIMKLTEAIEEYCSEEIDFKKIIKEIDFSFKQEEQEELIQRMNQLPEKLAQMKKRIDKGLEYYDRMEKLNRHGKITGKEFKTLVAKVGAISEEIRFTPEMDIVSIYNQAEEHNVLDQVFESKDSAYEDIMHVVKSGRLLLESYRRACDETLKAYQGLHEVKRSEIQERVDLLNKKIDEFELAFKNGEKTEINVCFKAFCDMTGNLLVDIPACETYEKTDLSELRNRTYEILGIVEEAIETENYGLAKNLRIEV